LGCKYSQALDAFFVDEKGERKPITMGCYGLGISRLMGTVVEVMNDKNGIIWPKEIGEDLLLRCLLSPINQYNTGETGNKEMWKYLHLVNPKITKSTRDVSNSGSDDLEEARRIVRGHEDFDDEEVEEDEDESKVNIVAFTFGVDK